jgi:hypothetical protein
VSREVPVSVARRMPCPFGTIARFRAVQAKAPMGLRPMGPVQAKHPQWAYGPMALCPVPENLCTFET